MATPEAPPDVVGTFARCVQTSAGMVPESRRFGAKVFIGDLYREHKCGTRSIEVFKARLLEAHRLGLLVLERADLVEALPRDAVRESCTSDTFGEYHFLVPKRTGRR